jgi:hypothetical protein
MAEETQPTKRYKSSETNTQNDMPQGTLIGEDLDTQFTFGERNLNKTETETITLKEKLLH